MKRKMISILALTLLVLTSLVFVSCQDFLPVAPEATVKEVVDEVVAQYQDFRPYIKYLATLYRTPEEVEILLELKLQEEYDSWNADVDVDCGADSISAKVKATVDEKHNLNINFTKIDLDTKANKIDGKFSMTIKLPDAGAASAHITDVSGDFSFSLTSDKVTFNTVTFRGDSFDTDAFNKEIDKRLNP